MVATAVAAAHSDWLAGCFGRGWQLPAGDLPGPGNAWDNTSTSASVTYADVEVLSQAVTYAQTAHTGLAPCRLDERFRLGEALESISTSFTPPCRKRLSAWLCRPWGRPAAVGARGPQLSCPFAFGLESICPRYLAAHLRAKCMQEGIS